MKILFKNYITLTSQESKDILTLRNSQNIRNQMITMDIIKSEDHITWINNLKLDPDKKYFSIFCDSLLVGSCSFTKNMNIITWGIYFKENTNPIVVSIICYLFLDYIFTIETSKINSIIKKTNTNAFHFNKNFGFELYKEDENYFYLELEKQKWENHKNSRLLKPIKNYLDKIEYEFK